MNLAEFMDRVGARPAAVARHTGLHISTVMRIQSGEHANPDGKTIQKLNRWASEVAISLGLPKDERLSWEHLLDGEDAA